MPGLLSAGFFNSDPEVLTWVGTYKAWRLVTVPLSILIVRDDLERPIETSLEHTANVEAARRQIFGRLMALGFDHPCRMSYWRYVTSLTQLDGYIASMGNFRESEMTIVVRECLRLMVHFYRSAIFFDLLRTKNYTCNL